jgi:hypothetical protein
LIRAVPNVILPPPINLKDDKAERDARLKPKRKQEVRKQGPMKAIVPVHNMTRASGLQKKGEEFSGCSFLQHMNKQWTKCYTLPSQCYRYCSHQVNEVLTEKDCGQRSGGCQDSMQVHSCFLWLSKSTWYIQ